MSFNEVEIDWNYLLEKLESLMDLGEECLSRQITEYELDPAVFTEYSAFRWCPDEGGYLSEIAHPDIPEFSDLIGLDATLQRLRQNTLQFVKALPSNNILLWGERGTGKSSAVKALLSEYASQGLRLIEVTKEGLFQLPLIAESLRPLPYRFILFCDDLTFDESEQGFRELKTLLEGGLMSRPKNIIVYATSNRRHLVPERLLENTTAEEIHPEETISEKLSLSDRFGITLGFYPLQKHEFLAIVHHLARKANLSTPITQLDIEAIQWARMRGALSGRVARQFIDDLSGRLATENDL